MAGPLDEAFVEISADFDNFDRAVRRGVDNAARNIDRVITRGLRRAENSAAKDGLRLGSTTGKNFSEGLATTLSSIVGIKLPTVGFVVLGGAMAAAAGAAVQLAAALAPAAGIVAGLPSVIGVASAGLSTLQVATMGVADAFEAAATGDAEEFSKAMEGLAPNVQSAAQAIRDLTPELEGLRNSVQDAFFRDFDDILNQLADTLLGPVTKGMTSVATSINGIITGLTDVATSAEGVDFVTQSFQIMADILDRLQDPLILLFDSLLSIGTAINEAFGENAGAGLADLITRFALFLDEAAASGDAVRWVEDALDVFRAVGDILSPIAGIFGSIGQAASATGGNILGVFGDLLQTFDDFLASAQGQDILITLFEALNTVGDAFATVLGNIAPALPPLIAGIASILDVVAPLLGPLSQLVGDVLVALAPILKIVANAIKPLIAPLTRIITLLGDILVDAITTLMPIIQPLIDILADQLVVWLDIVAESLESLSPVIGSLLEAIVPLIEESIPLIEIFASIANLVGAILIPIIQVLGVTLAWLVDTIIAPIVIPALTFLVRMFADYLVKAGEGFMIAMNSLALSLTTAFTNIGNGFKLAFNFIVSVYNTTVNALKIGASTINLVVFTPLKNGINTVRSVVSAALSGIRSGFDSFVSFIKGIPGKISSSLSSLFSPLASGFRSAINSVIDGWNGLSFTVPSISLGALGSVGGFTVSTPNIPRLQTGGFTTNTGLAMLHPEEVVLPLSSQSGISTLASALKEALATLGTDSGGGAVAAGNNTFIVRIGERELNDIVVEQVNDMNQTMLRRARTGTRRNG